MLPFQTGFLHLVICIEESLMYFCGLTVDFFLCQIIFYCVKEPELKMKVAQLCPTFQDPIYIVHGILQARILEWVAFSFSRGSSQSRDQT